MLKQGRKSCMSYYVHRVICLPTLHAHMSQKLYSDLKILQQKNSIGWVGERISWEKQVYQCLGATFKPGKKCVFLLFE